MNLKADLPGIGTQILWHHPWSPSQPLLVCPCQDCLKHLDTSSSETALSHILSSHWLSGAKLMHGQEVPAQV